MVNYVSILELKKFYGSISMTVLLQ